MTNNYFSKRTFENVKINCDPKSWDVSFGEGTCAIVSPVTGKLNGKPFKTRVLTTFDKTNGRVARIVGGLEMTNGDYFEVYTDNETIFKSLSRFQLNIIHALTESLVNNPDAEFHLQWTHRLILTSPEQCEFSNVNGVFRIENIDGERTGQYAWTSVHFLGQMNGLDCEGEVLCTYRPTMYSDAGEKIDESFTYELNGVFDINSSTVVIERYDDKAVMESLKRDAPEFIENCQKLTKELFQKKWAVRRD